MFKKEDCFLHFQKDNSYMLLWMLQQPEYVLHAKLNIQSKHTPAKIQGVKEHYQYFFN